MLTRFRSSSPTRTHLLVSLVAGLALSGCSQIYDDTKGWGNDVEAWFRADVLAPIGAEIRGEPYPPRENTPAVAQGTAEPATQMAAAQEAKSDPMMKKSMAKDQMAKDTRIASTSSSLPAATRAPSEQPKPAQTNSNELGANVYPQTAGKAPEKAPMEKPAMAAKETESAVMTKPAGAAMSLHLSSNKTKDSAMREWAQLKTAFPKQLGELKPEIARTDLGKKGIFFRVLAGPFKDKPAAAQVCSELKKKQQYCAVMPAPTGKG